jgi:tetratricopeptide (TPR) repeat protein
MGEELELPSDLYGFGGLLLWVLATRATQVVDRCFARGPARPSPQYGTVDGHPVPTPSLVAWLLTAAEFGIPLDELARHRDAALDRRHHVLRTLVNRALQGRPELFENRWLDHLAGICQLGAAERELLAAGRDETGQGVDPPVLRRAIAQTLRTRRAAGAAVKEKTTSTRALPRDNASFTGREQELQQFVAAAATPRGGIAGIHAIGGMAGVGKTAFAVHAAHLLAPRFPDGQIFMSLHGHTPGRPPVTPADALARLLQIVGVSAAHIPADLEARAALWRDQLAGRRILLLLDDAAGHEQVRPLLPGTGGGLVIITSRRRLTALEDMRAVSLDVLTPGEAARLFIRLVDHPDLEPGNAGIGQIVRLCGYLPLTIGMQARRLHHHPSWTVADLATDLASARDRLALMQAENLSVAAAFDLSYRDLGEAEQHLFRWLGLHPGDHIDVYAAAALSGAGVPATGRHLEALYDHYLLTEPSPGRYQLHDLVREHARTLTTARDGCDQALDRLLDYYQYTAATAANLLSRHPASPAAVPAVGWPPAAVPAVADRRRALTWARAERMNLMACLDQATRAGLHTRVIGLTAGIAALLRHDGPWTDALTCHGTALRAARRAGCRLGEANAQYELAAIQRLTGNYGEATQTQQAALGIYRDLGNRLGEGNVQHELAVIQRLSGNYAEATATLQAALGIYRDLGNRLGEANAQLERGALAYLVGDYPVAIEAHQAALRSYRQLGDDLGQADALLYLGAIRYLGGEMAEATELIEAALGIYRDQDDQHGQANALQQLGTVRRISGDYAGATKAFQATLQICCNLGYRGGEANALHYLAVTRRLTGDYEEAAEALSAALDIYRDIGDLGGEAEALNEAGTLHVLRGSLPRAEAAHRKALEIARSIDSGWDEAHALAGIGRSARAADQTTRARAYLRQAQEILAGVSPDEAAEIAAELDALDA